MRCQARKCVSESHNPSALYFLLSGSSFHLYSVIYYRISNVLSVNSVGSFLRIESFNVLLYCCYSISKLYVKHTLSAFDDPFLWIVNVVLIALSNRHHHASKNTLEWSWESTWCKCTQVIPLCLLKLWSSIAHWSLIDYYLSFLWRVRAWRQLSAANISCFTSLPICSAIESYLGYLLTLHLLLRSINTIRLQLL